MSEGAEQDKSEQATPFKLMRAREKGSVARGTDLGFLTGLAALTGYLWIMGPGLAGEVGHAAADALIVSPHVAGGANEILEVAGLVLARVSGPLAGMAGTIFLAVLLLELVQTGVVFTAEPLKPDFSRLNPGKGLKRLFTLKLLIETVKNVAKMAAYVMVAWFVLRSALDTGAAAITDGRSLLGAMAAAGFKLLACFIGVALVFAALDQMIARRQFLKQMRMSRRELRREHRDREGEPRIKQRRKQLHAEFTKASEGLRNVRGADVVITNPTHIAVALRYDPATMTAPRLVASGANNFAARIKRLAFIYGVVVVEDKPLARELFRTCALNQPVPETCYRKVADVYLALRRKASDQAEPEHA